MATAHLQGTARLQSGSLEHKLAVPLKQITPIHVRQRHEWWSADNTTRETVALGTDAVQDIEATIRFENQPEALQALLASVLEDGAELEYFKEESGAGIACTVVAVNGGDGAISLSPDPDRYGYGEWACRVRLRAVGSDDWSSIL
jgi:hypothetical protein